MVKLLWKTTTNRAPVSPEIKYNFKNFLLPRLCSSSDPILQRAIMFTSRCRKLPCINMLVNGCQILPLQNFTGTRPRVVYMLLVNAIPVSGPKSIMLRILKIVKLAKAMMFIVKRVLTDFGVFQIITSP
jgi:hypothetical protein